MHTLILNSIVLLQDSASNVNILDFLAIDKITVAGILGIVVYALAKKLNTLEARIEEKDKERDKEREEENKRYYDLIVKHMDILSENNRIINESNRVINENNRIVQRLQDFLDKKSN